MLSYTNPYQTTAIIKTYVHVDISDELAEITNWLLFLGGDLLIKEAPDEVLEGVQARLNLFYP
ncbi:hypothetical protein D3C75_1316710 [compost metagenome]